MTAPLTSTTPAGSAVSLTTATPANVASLVLSTGTWLVWGNVDASLTGATLTSLIASLSLSSGVVAPQPGQNLQVQPVQVPQQQAGRLGPDPTSQLLASLSTVTGTQTLDCGPTIVTVPPGHTVRDASGNDVPAPTPTLYLVAQASFSAGSVAAYGSLFAMPIPAS
jgi:hypothetical protein